jgi:hypothetical protein
MGNKMYTFWWFYKVEIHDTMDVSSFIIVLCVYFWYEFINIGDTQSINYFYTDGLACTLEFAKYFKFSKLTEIGNDVYTIADLQG